MQSILLAITDRIPGVIDRHGKYRPLEKAAFCRVFEFHLTPAVDAGDAFAIC
jgi:hypothetical protein